MRNLPCNFARLCTLLQIETFSTVPGSLSLEYLSAVSRKALTKALKDVLLPVPLYRSLYRSVPGQDMLSRVKKMAVLASVKTFIFKLHTSTLPVKTWMQEKGFFVAGPTTRTFGNKPETVEHVFVEYLDAIFFWDVLQRTLKIDLPVSPQGIRFLCVPSDNSVPYDLIMALGLHAIWRSRMAVRHADPQALTVSKYFAQSVSLLYEVHKWQTPDMGWLPVLEELCTFVVYFKFFRQPKFGRRFFKCECTL